MSAGYIAVVYGIEIDEKLKTIIHDEADLGWDDLKLNHYYSSGSTIHESVYIGFEILSNQYDNTTLAEFVKDANTIPVRAIEDFYENQKIALDLVIEMLKELEYDEAEILELTKCILKKPELLILWGDS